MNEPVQGIVSVVGDHLSDIAISLYTYLSWKIILSILTSAFVFFFGISHTEILKMLLALTGIDMISGMIAAWKSGYPIESRKALKSATKVAVYGLLISAAVLTEKIVPGITYMDEAVISFLALTELISVVENIGTAGYAVPMKLLNRIKELRDRE